MDVWDPAKGAYVPTWNRQVAAILGSAPDGLLLGAVTATESSAACLARLDPAAKLRVVSHDCSIAAGPDSLASPGGRYVVARVSAEGSAVFDAATGAKLVTLPAPSESPDEPVWVGPATLLAPAGDAPDGAGPVTRFMRVDLTDPAGPRSQYLRMPPNTASWRLVPVAGS